MRNTLNFLTGLISILSSCNQPSRTHEGKQTHDIIINKKQSQTKKLKAYADAYVYLDNTLTETLFVNELSEKTIDFMWVLTNNNLHQSDTIQGLATANSVGQDYEIDEDENGISYPTKEYKLKNGGCDIHVRISADKDIHRATLKSANCKTARGSLIQSIGSLRLTE